MKVHGPPARKYAVSPEIRRSLDAAQAPHLTCNEGDGIHQFYIQKHVRTLVTDIQCTVLVSCTCHFPRGSVHNKTPANMPDSINVMHLSASIVHYVSVCQRTGRHKPTIAGMESRGSNCGDQNLASKPRHQN